MVNLGVILLVKLNGTYWRQRMTTCAFALCAKRLMKLTPEGKCCHIFFRASLKNVFFPSVTLCNINQGRSSLFHHLGLANNDSLLRAVHSQAYHGSVVDLSPEEMSAVASIFASEEVIRYLSFYILFTTATPFKLDHL
jgi:hypothetical protein